MSGTQARILNQYRFYCSSESNLKYVWSDHVPMVCPAASNHTIDLSSLTIVDKISEHYTFLQDVPRDPYGDLRVLEKTPIIELKSCFGTSAIRDVIQTTGVASVNNTIGESAEFNLNASISNSSAILQSAERGRYVAGYGAEAGIAIRMTSLSNGQMAQWGLYDGSDGFLYRLTGSNLSLVISRSSVETVIPRQSFNVDKMDGTGPSGVNINLNDGKIFNIMFSWYGYGMIDFRVVSMDENLNQRYFSMHRFLPTFQTSETSVKNPNLPLYAEIRNTTYNGPGNIYVAGRQYSIIGPYVPLRRINCAYRIDCSINSTAQFLPVLSLRRKQNYKGNAVKISSADIIVSTQQIVQIRTNVTLADAVWTNINDQVSSETCMEMDTTSTLMTGGVVIWTGIFAPDTAAQQHIDKLMYDLSEQQVITICSKAFSVTNGSLSLCARWTEEW